MTWEMTVRGDGPIASNADYQAGRPISGLNVICYDPPGEYECKLEWGQAFFRLPKIS